MGVSYFKLGSIPQCLQVFQSAIEKYPFSPDIYTYYGEILLGLQKDEEAEVYFKKGFSFFYSYKKTIN